MTEGHGMKDKRVGILMGGMSAEREVSIASGQAVQRALDALGYATVPLFVDRDLDQLLRQEPIDVAFLALHGTWGEDGCVQGLLEVMGRDKKSTREGTAWILPMGPGEVEITQEIAPEIVRRELEKFLSG